jgi:hypothetical protein
VPLAVISAMVRTRGIGSVIPEPDDQKAHRKRIGSSGGGGGWPTRYDKHAIVYRGGLVLAAGLLWLTDLGDTS